jgi:dienelactone hydrolase
MRLRIDVHVKLLVLVVLAAAVAACVVALDAGSAASRATKAVLSVTPNHALVDQPVSIMLSGLPKHSLVTVTATTRDAYHHRWRSSAIFRSDTHGIVVVSRSFSLGGSYRGVEAMGLFQWMRLVGSRSPLNQQALLPASRSTVTLDASIAGKTAATASMIRRTQAAGLRVRFTTLARQGFIGCYYAPTGMEPPRPAVLFIGGSSGGLPCGYVQSLLASHGYPTLGLAYFGVPGLPQNLERIPLEYFQRALRWLAKQPGVNPKRLVPLGISRGGEAALLVGVSYPSLVHGAAEYVGGAIVGISPHASNIPAWTRNGKALPTGAPIQVWRINGPLFLVGAGDDSFGDSSSAVENLAAALKTRHRHDYTALTYNHAGHGLGSMVPYLPFGNAYLRFGVPTSFGGTLAADAAARADSWSKLLGFLAAQR